MLQQRSVGHITLLTLFLKALFVSAVVKNGPLHPPTKGEVWPEPRHQITHSAYFSFEPARFNVTITNQNCKLLSRAKKRYTLHVFNKISKLANQFFVAENSIPQHDYHKYLGLIKELQIDLTSTCEDYPHIDMDESYSLTVLAQAELKSKSIWGILRGLETFAQLFYLTDDYKEVRINMTEITDFPRYAHRGILLDTSRHFISMRNILRTLDAMAINKMNVFHWHMVDDQSFPYQSHKFPELSARGAFHPSMVYTKCNIDKVVEYARERGIRVIPEFDVPGHTHSWGEAYPNILTKCYNAMGKVTGLGPLDPTNNITYKLLTNLFNEVQEWFPDAYLHVGGDEVDFYCWKSNPQIRKYMKHNNVTNEIKLHSHFMRNIMLILANRSRPIVWQEVFDEGIPLPKDTFVQVWKEKRIIRKMVEVLKAGHRVVFSSAWYLDYLGHRFQKYYSVDPRQMVLDATRNETLALNVVGGEACVWGEMIDDRNLLPSVWPRASAVAERLWSTNHKTHERRTRIPKLTLCRIEEHVCRMIRRGIPAQPASGPGYCIT